MKKIQLHCTVIVAIFCFLPLIESAAQNRIRTEVDIPGVPGYVTIKCDFHMHSVFSDGTVWPTVRAEEIWREGLDAFALTDHIEYLPHERDMRIDFNRSYEIASGTASTLDVMIVRAAEITRKMPPGHFNALFLKDVKSLHTEKYQDAFQAAIDQGAFIFWNHPGWTGQQPDGISRWYPEHTELYEKGWLHGIEIVNGRTYYPEAHRWCLEKNLTMLGNSDIHDPTSFEYDLVNGDHRPMTLVFARGKNINALKEALFARRTVVYSGHMLIGIEKFLKPIFDQSVEIKNPEVEIYGNGRVYLQIHNNSEISYELQAEKELPQLAFPKSITLFGNKTVLLPLRSKSDTLSGEKSIFLSYRVNNLLIAPGEGLPIQFTVQVRFHPVLK